LENINFEFGLISASINQLQPRKTYPTTPAKHMVPINCELVTVKTILMQPLTSPQINKNKKTIAFYAHNKCASQVSLSGSFNNWAQDVLIMKPEKDGLWKIEIPMLPEGKYSYKFFVDDKMWMEDVDNPLREPDGLIGFNSILTI
jgi:hypothetical protein